MDSGWNADAMKQSEKFPSSLRENHALKHLVWFFRGFYTRDVEAITQSNIGAVIIREWDLDQAEERLARAIQVDIQCPILYSYVALIGKLRGDRDTATESLSAAHSLGYQQTSIEEITNKAASILATIDGRRKKPSSEA